MALSANDLRQWEGEIVPRSFMPGYIVLSYIVSYIGALTTLELLHKRTAGRGLYNWYVPLSAFLWPPPRRTCSALEP